MARPCSPSHWTALHITPRVDVCMRGRAHFSFEIRARTSEIRACTSASFLSSPILFATSVSRAVSNCAILSSGAASSVRCLSCLLHQNVCDIVMAFSEVGVRTLL